MTIDTAVKQDLKRDLKKPLAGLGGGISYLPPLLGATYAQTYLSPGGQFSSLAASPDGSKVALNANPNTWREMTLSPAGDLLSPTLGDSTKAIVDNHLGMSWKNDGTSLFYITDGGVLRERPVGTAYEVNSGFNGDEVAGQDLDGLGIPLRGFAWSNDGNKLFALRAQDTSPEVWALNTANPWQITSGISLSGEGILDLNADGRNFLNNQEGDLDLTPDGKYLSVIQSSGAWQTWELVTPWSLTGAVFLAEGNLVSLNGNVFSSRGITILPGLNRVLIADIDADSSVHAIDYTGVVA